MNLQELMMYNELLPTGLVRGSTFDDSSTASGASAATTPGIATPGRAGLGQMFKVTDPITGRSVTLPKIDVGPAGWTHRGVDISPGGARALGLPSDAAGFPTDRQFNVEAVGQAQPQAGQFGFRTNYFRGALPSADSLSRFKFGDQTITAHPQAAPYFQGFLGYLKDQGAPVGDVGSYNVRNIEHSNRLSQHSYGNAIDIGNQTGRDEVSPDFRNWVKNNPQTWRSALNQYGMVSGGDWTHPDLGHVEWGGPGGLAESGVVGSGATSIPSLSGSVGANPAQSSTVPSLAQTLIGDATKLENQPGLGGLGSLGGLPGQLTGQSQSNQVQPSPMLQPFQPGGMGRAILQQQLARFLQPQQPPGGAV